MDQWSKKRRIMQRYDLTAHIYDMRYAEEQTAKIEKALSSLKTENYGLVLDVGCGTGILFDHVADKADTIIGVDFSRKILLQAKKRVKNLHNTHLLLADADNMPLKSNMFNYIFCITLLQNMPNQIKTLNEIKRTAKKDAVIVVSGLKKVFTQLAFERLLAKADLQVVALKSENLKCHIAICTKLHH